MNPAIMKRARIRVPLALLVVLFYSAASAAIPTTLDYQGYLTDPSGLAIDDTLPVLFAIYTVPSGGVPVWISEKLVTVSQGLFSVDLGGPATPFPPQLFQTPLWLGVSVAGDAEMAPRRALTSVGFAFTADNADTVDGFNAATLNQSAHVASMANPHGVTAAQSGAATSADIASLQAQITSLQASLAAAQGDITALEGELVIEVNARVAADIVHDAADVAHDLADSGHDTAITSIQANTVLDFDNVLTLAGTTARFSNVNLQVVNGTGTTGGTPNGLGNLIVGYDQADTFDPPVCSNGLYDNENDCEINNGNWEQFFKSGSHNIIVGDRHNYSGYGGLVAGWDNNILANWASVTGGQDNTAGRGTASVSGGRDNRALGEWASISGGKDNTADGQQASVAGGRFNVASGSYASVGGGLTNEASGANASVTGGSNNIASAPGSIAIGGDGNLANVSASAVAADLALSGALDCPECIDDSDVDPLGGVYAGKQAVYTNSTIRAVEPGDCLPISVSCSDGNDLPLQAHCSHESGTVMSVGFRESENWDSLTDPAAFNCNVCNQGEPVPRQGRASILCLTVN